MTLRELSQLYYLKREIDDCKKRLEELELLRCGSSVIVDDMPHGKGPAKSKVEQLAAEIVDLKAIIHAKRIECIHEKNRLERYIASISDSEIRMIFEFRFADCLTWDQVAERMGEGNTAERVRQVCSRYVRQQQDPI